MTTIDKIITFLTETSPQPQDTNAIAQGTDISVSTIRKNLKKMREANTVAYDKQGNSTYYTLPQTEQAAETPAETPEQSIPQPEPETPEQPATVEPTITDEKPATPSFNKPEQPAEVEVNVGGEDSVVVNPETKASTSDLIDVLTRRKDKWERRMQSATTPKQQRFAKSKYKRAARRLETLQAQHG